MTNEIIDKKKYFDFEILEKYEAGMVLYGWEVKAIMKKSASIKGSHIIVRNGELFILNSKFTYTNVDTSSTKYLCERNRKLLLKKSEINRLIGKVKEKRLTIIPLRIYLKGKKYKIEIALARGKNEYDKREAIKVKDLKKEASENLKKIIRKF